MAIIGNGTREESISYISGVQLKETQTASDGQTVFTLVNFNYNTGTNAINVYVNGVRQANGAFIESSGSTITMSSGLSEGDTIEFVTSEPVSSITANSVNSIASLLLRPKVGTVEVNSYHGDGNGGGGTFYWDGFKSKTEHNGGTVIDPSKVFPTDWNNQTQLASWFTAPANGSGCWVRQYDGTVSVKWFGAKGDGVTDDYLPLYNADKSVADIGNVILPNGTFYLGSPFFQKANSLEGAGIKTTTIRFGIKNHTEDCYTIWTGYSPKTAKNFTIDANQTGLDCLAIISGDSHVIEDISISNAYRNGYALKAKADWTWIENLTSRRVKITNSGLHGIYMFTANGVDGNPFINECLFEEIEVRGVSLRAPSFGLNIATDSLQLGAALYAHCQSSDKMSSNNFISCNFDAQRQTALDNGSEINYSPVVLADGKLSHVIEGAGKSSASSRYESWRFIGGGWETTTAGPYYNFQGYALISAETQNIQAVHFTTEGLVGGGWSDTTGVFGDTNFGATIGGASRTQSVHKGKHYYKGDIVVPFNKITTGSYFDSYKNATSQVMASPTTSTTTSIDIPLPVTLQSLYSTTNFMHYELMVSYEKYGSAPSSHFKMQTYLIMFAGRFSGLRYATANSFELAKNGTFFTIDSIVVDHVNAKITVNITTASDFATGGGSTDIYITLSPKGGYYYN